MKVEIKEVSPVKRTMSVEVDAETVARHADEVLGGYSRQAKIPGFRPGKAPRAVIKKRYAKQLEEDIREQVVTKAYRDAAVEHKIQPLGDPLLDKVEYKEGESLRFTTTFEVLPEFEAKGYKGLELRRPSAALEADAVDKTLEEIRQSRMTLEADEGKAVTDSVLIADVDGTPDEGEPFQREKMFVEVGSTENLPAFNEGLEGAGVGDTVEFPVEYPDEYPEKSLAGKRVEYKVTVHELKKKVLPELDDEFAKDLGDFADLAALRARIEEDLTKRKENQAQSEVRQRLLDKLLVENPVVLPEVLVEQEVRSRLEEIARRLISQGIDLDQAGLDWSKMRKEQEESCRKSVHARLVLDAVARAEDIQVTDEEVDERITRDAAQMGENPDKLREGMKKHGGLQPLKNQILREKSLDLLTAVANIQNEE